jgi:hydroxyethylthiazole kinase-like uncharacterized protein yjeF
MAHDAPALLLDDRRVPPHLLPLHRREAAVAHERASAVGLPPGALMARAGAAVARLARALRPHAPHVLLLAGPGNNGGDAWEAATRLHAAGVDCSLCWLGDMDRLPADAARARRGALAAGVKASPWGSDAPPSGTALVIDGVFGRGLQRPLSSDAAGLCQTVNGWGLPVLAIDVPSGLDADTGMPPAAGPVLRAHWTLALLSLPPGLFTGQGRDVAGAVWYHDLACPPPADTACAALEGHEIRALGPLRPADGHKGRFGDLHVVGGAPGMVGAAWLSARSALLAGAGRVHLHLLDPDASLVDPVRPELMARAHRPDDPRLADATVVAGCGGGVGIRGVMPDLLERAGPMVLDADALNALAQTPSLGDALRRRADRGQVTVLTPHPLEAARLLGWTVGEVQADRLAAAHALAQAFDCLAVLKGSGTVTAAPGATLRVNPTGHAALSTPGSGDVLAGWIGGWWAQAPAPAARATFLDLASRAVFLHGLAAQRRHPRGHALPAADQPPAMAELLAGPA